MSTKKRDMLLSDVNLISLCREFNIKLNAILSKDEYNSISPELGCYIINLQDAQEGNGTHWTCITVHKTYILYFDPFGIPIPRPIKHFMSRNSKNVPVYFSEDQIQPIDSVFCGWYCLFFLYFTSVLHKTQWNGHRLLDWHNSMYSLTNRHLNDRILQALIKKYLVYQKLLSRAI